MKHTLVKVLSNLVGREAPRSSPPQPYPLPPLPDRIIERGAIRVDLADPRYFHLTEMEVYYLRKFLEA